MSGPLVRRRGDRCELTDPVAMPRACGFLFNPGMMMQVNCRGYVTARHMQPEPARYSHPPLLEATVFMQPEQPYFAHHPGRFVYVKDERDGTLFSLPHEPVRAPAKKFVFSVGPADIRWEMDHPGLACRLEVALPPDEAVELWTFEIRNTGNSPRSLSVYPLFTIGYMSWMNQSARYEPALGGIVARSISGYQQLEQWDEVRRFKDCTFFLHDTVPEAWEAGAEAFEGEGGLHLPDGVTADRLARGEAIYEMPAAALQYRLMLEPGESRRYRFLFGPARDDSGIEALRNRYFRQDAFEAARVACRHYQQEGSGCLEISTPDSEMNDFVNTWLPRQVFYHGHSNRLSTDPQTRNYLQDAMGAVYVQPELTRRAILTTLSQQEDNGALPDGIRLFPGAELKYINQVPHTDHCAWLPLCLQAFLDETGDFALLEAAVESESSAGSRSVFERTDAAMNSLLDNLDDRGLSLIAQGDWCDPMNMAGHRGKGVSGWLTIATVHALKTWADICAEAGKADRAEHWRNEARPVAGAVQKHLWEGEWFARGITDDGRTFGTRADDEGTIFLNPQGWALMAGIATAEQQESLLAAVRERLETPWGVMMLDPPFTRMHEDIGRLTQKFPGYAENASIYNHAAAFYAHGLYIAGHADAAWDTLRRMLPGPDEEDLLRRGQLPVFIPNYYRGAVRLHPATAGRSSQLFNTGSASWVYRIVIEQLFGLRGCREGLRVDPQLPSHWESASVSRKFRGATFEVNFARGPASFTVDGKTVEDRLIRGIEPGKTYRVHIVQEPGA